MAKEKKEKVEKEVKVVDEVKVEEVVEENVVKTEGKGKVVKLNLKYATFEDGTIVKITSRKQHSELKRLR
tara:strand:- start:1403 stop:1612 length:210 start_codon:yes stop_codon:yes gene_type:complete